MTDDDTRQRRQAAAVLLKMTRTEQGRHLLSAAGHRSGQPLIIVLDTDTIGSVLGRMIDEQPTSPAVFAMYCGADDKPHRMDFFTMTPDGATEVAEQDVVDVATIGMLLDTMHANNATSWALRITQPAHVSATLHTNELADAH